MSDTNNSNNNSNEGDQGKVKTGDGGENSSTQNDQNQNQSSNNVDLKTLPPDQLQQVLENPNLWETPRLKELVQSNKELKELKDKQSQEQETKLKDEKKFEELVEKKSQENSSLKSQLESMQQNQALTNLLVKEKVVDLDGALKLVDRSAINIKDDGTVEGAEKAVESLKTDKAYLFSNQSGSGVGTASNAGNQNQSQGTPKFKRSQLQGPEGTKFYQDNKKEVDEAYSKGLIEDDIST